jgi:hypothetical protein
MLSGLAVALHLTTAKRAGLDRESRPFGGRTAMRQFEILDVHARAAARFRRLLANATTPSLKARLAAQAAEHERLAKKMEDQGQPDNAARPERALAET